MKSDDITRAVLAREDVTRYVRGVSGASEAETRQRIEEYLDELRTTQRYRFYRALQHPLYPILRKVRRIAEHVEHAIDGTSRGRVVYVSNHKSHLDYLIEPLVLDDNGVRPPLLAAGINLFGGALGLLHRHVTGAIPIRRNSKDPVYLVTLRAYMAEVLKRRDLLYYAEGGPELQRRAEDAEDRAAAGGAPGRASRAVVVPMAVAYDLVLEERILAREAIRRRSRPFAQEVAEMVRHAVGYHSRGVRDVRAAHPAVQLRSGLASRSRHAHASGARRDWPCYKVLPTALVASVMRPHMTRAELVGRIDDLLSC